MDELKDDLTETIIGACIEVHRALGPGLLESVYEHCVCRELELRGVAVERQVPIPFDYKGVFIECAYRIDLLVARRVVVELKAVAEILPIHLAQVLTYLKLMDRPVGLLINFNVTSLRKNI